MHTVENNIDCLVCCITIILDTNIYLRTVVTIYSKERERLYCSYVLSNNNNFK